MPYRRRPIPKRAEGVAKVVVREQRPVTLSAAKAEAIVPASLLLKKLGKSAFRLWSALLTMRNEECESHPSTHGLMEATGLSGRNIARCFTRLRAFGLVEDFGFMYLMVPCRCPVDIGCTGHKVYVRNVYGLLKASEDQQTQSALVPRHTAKLVNEAAAHGGKREGAGRPSGAKDKEPRRLAVEAGQQSSVSAYKYQELVSQKNLKVLLRNAEFHSAHNSTSLEAGKGVQLEAEAHSRPPKEPVMPSPLQLKAQPDAILPALTEAPTAPATAGSGFGLMVDGKPCDLLDALRAEGAQSFELGGSYKGPKQRYTPDDLRAATDLSSVIEVLRVPPPPKLQPEHTETHQLHLLRAAYRAVHEKVMGTDYWRPAKQQAAKERDAFLAACEALRCENISPTSWARFAFHQWHRMGQKSAPTPKWVWTAARIHEHANWCHQATGTINTQTVVPLAASKELIERLATLRQRLGWGRPTDAVVSEVLPAPERQRLLIQQQEQVEAGRRDVERRINNGEWVWG